MLWLAQVMAVVAPLAVGAQGPEVLVPGQSAQAPDDEALVRAARAFAGRIVLVEAVRKDGPAERVLFSRAGVVIGPRHVMTVAPRLAAFAPAGLSPSGPGRPEGAARPEGPPTPPRTDSPGGLQHPPGESGVTVRITTDDGSGAGRRTLAAQNLRIDPQTGLAVLEAADLKGAVLNFNPAPALENNATVVVVEPGGEGRLTVRRGKLLQARAHLDQGKGKNPLLLLKLEDGRRGGRSYTRWQDDLVSGAGAVLTDSEGGFLGIITPPFLDSERPEKSGEAPSSRLGTPPRKPQEPKGSRPEALKEGEVLALPAEIARLLSETLARGKTPVRGYLGASFREVRDAPEEVRRLGAAKALARVEKVYPGGPADQGGLRSGDWLLGIAEKKGVTYTEVVHFSELVEYTGHGKTVHLTVARPGDGARPGDSGLQVQNLRIRIGNR